jgi:hypothetical protein
MLLLNHSSGFGLPSSTFALGGALDVADVFSTDLWTGNGTSQTITNGVDLSGEGGMVWIKYRDVADNHFVHDTEMGVNQRLLTNSTLAEGTSSSSLTAFNSDGFDIGSSGGHNTNLGTYVGWTFRKAAGFFDIVTYTGNATNRTISHNLGATPGLIIVKCTSQAGRGWPAYHRSNTANPETDYMLLNATQGTNDSNLYWNDTAPTDTVFSLGTEGEVNASSQTFVAYLFSHDADGIIQCGSYTGNGSATGPTVSLGWEPQWLMIKQSSAAAESWNIWDSARSVSNDRDDVLRADSSAAESVNNSARAIEFSATGFQPKTSNGAVNTSSETYIYMAIKAES